MANEMRDAIKGNDHSDIRKIAEAGDAALAAAILANTEPADTVTVADPANRYTGTNVETCLAEIAGASRTTETVKGNNTLILANTAAIDALERSGSTVTVAGVAADADRDVTLTIKNGAASPAAVAAYAMIGVKVTKGDGNGVDTGDPAVIDTDLVTSTGLVVSSGEQLVPSNGAAISNAGNANLIAFTNADGTLVVTPTAKTNNLFVFVHFIMPDGTVEKSAEIKLKEV
ncbi:MAG TPA: hypothetical protein PLZ43_09215 [bacterium]|nr:hypothetical protein [bacterium]